MNYTGDDTYYYYKLDDRIKYAQIDKVTGKIIRLRNNTKTAASTLGIQSSSICNCCHHVAGFTTAGGFKRKKIVRPSRFLKHNPSLPGKNSLRTSTSKTDTNC